jgi:arylsulfatase A-like enzyme
VDQRRFIVAMAGLILSLAVFAAGRGQVGEVRPRRNVIVFVADGLRPGSINEQDMPVLSAMRARGVEFRDSYSLFPTLTMPNASVIATGSRLGDTAIFGNTVWLAHPSFDKGNFKRMPASPVAFLENDQMLGDVGDHGGTGLLGEETLLALARAHGYRTAAIGKLGPTAMQDPSSIRLVGGAFPPPSSTIIVDDLTGTAAGVPLPASVLARLGSEGLSLDAPARSNGYGATSRYNNGYAGDNAHPGTLSANVVQQQWLADVATRAVLPLIGADPRTPFALVFWSRDPDGTQHNQGDSLGALTPGINGVTSRHGVQNADRTLGQLLAWLDARPAIKANTDVIVTSDHGFSTISRREVDRFGHSTTSEAAKHRYRDGSGKVDTEKGMLPPGFLAIDLALDLQLKLFDPARRAPDGASGPYRELRLAGDEWDHPAGGNGLLAASVQKPDGSDADIVVAANGGSDLIYVPDGRAATVQAVVHALLGHDYVGGVFVDDRFGSIPGSLPLSAIGLSGAGALPRPDIVVAFKVFYLDPDDLQTAVQLADTGLQEGQGNHGGFGRDNTHNTMIAIGPDFKAATVDSAPVSNADIVPTLAHVLGFDVRPAGNLRGRVAQEALMGSPDAAPGNTQFMLAQMDQGSQTILFYEERDGERYLQAACLLSAGQSTRDGSRACR